MNRTASTLRLLFLLAGLAELSGCKQWKQVFGTRPSQNMPAVQPVTVMFADQHWNAAQREWFYHTPQGTELIPYQWFLALEQPQPTLFRAAPPFADPAYLARFGFLPDSDAPGNPNRLPVGFAKDTVHNPRNGETVEVIGLTCAACHTGQLEFRGQAIRIDGGSASVELAAFQTELGYAVAFTDKLPFRFDRFARRVLGQNASADAKQKLHEEFRTFMSTGLAEAQAAEDGNLYAAGGGFGRTDALGRIGNYLFGTELDTRNLRVADAPVKLPPLWYTSWFNAVQYNASIEQPMVRNIGEALGVRAPVNLVDPGNLYRSTVNVPNLWRMEEQLAGQTAFGGLASPKWPAETFGALDPAKVAHGADLYRQHCEHCHLPPINSPEIQKGKYWVAGLGGRRFLKLNVIPLDEIGTDPKEATNFADRKADTGILGKGIVSAAAGLRLITTEIRDRSYDALGLSPEQRMEWNGYREDVVDAPLGYRARPLAGMWATPPFLHNGSVPNLYELLSPASQRSPAFYTGRREFDPTLVGYESTAFPGAFGFKTDAVGNSDAGHEFRNTPGKGVIGPELTKEDRFALIEYLKSL